MKRVCISLSLGIVMLSATVGAAQQDCQQRMISGAKMMNLSPIGMKSEQVSDALTSALRMLIPVMVECALWAPDRPPMLAAYETDKPPVVKIARMGQTINSPTATADEITFPADFVFPLWALGMIAAHDAEVRGRLPRPVRPDELGTTPYRRSMVAPLYSPLYNFIQPDTFPFVRPDLACPEEDTACSQLLSVGIMVPIWFAVLHENAHQRLHHPASAVRTVDQELDADDSALRAMRILRDNVVGVYPPAVARAASWMFDAIPVLWLKAQAVHNPSDQSATARLNAALQFNPGLARSLSTYISSEHRKLNLTTLSLKINHPVQSFLIDGVRVSSEDIPQGGLLISNQEHVIVAICSDGIAVSDNVGDPDFDFNSLGSQTALEKIEQDESDGNYSALLAETSDSNLEPRTDGLMWYQFEALHNLRLDALISPKASVKLSESQRTQVATWQKMHEPVGSWRYVSDTQH